MICWNCKAENEDGDECCGACGEGLVHDVGAQSQAPSPPAAVTTQSTVAMTAPTAPAKTQPAAPAKPGRQLFPSPGARGLFPSPGATRPDRPNVVAIENDCECGAPFNAFTTEGDGKRICNDCGVSRINPERDDFYIKVADTLVVRSNIGRKHEDNQDYGWAGQMQVAGKTVSWWVVSDGISRAEKSEQASKGACLAVDDTIRQLLAQGRKDAQGIVDRAMRMAQKAVLTIPISPETLKPDSRLQPPGATLVVALVMDGNITVGWLGDSRAYLLSRAPGQPEAVTAVMLTRDHSYINYLIDEEGLSFEAALKKADKDSHAIMRSLGTLERGVELEPSFKTVACDGAFALLGCSDGFWNYAHAEQDQPADKIAAFFTSGSGGSGSALDAANAMIDFANQAGGVDNITVCLLTL